MAWLNRKSSVLPSVEAQMAKESAEESRAQALEDLARSKERLQESRPTIEALQAHNEKNHYDEWLRSLVEGVNNDNR